MQIHASTRVHARGSCVASRPGDCLPTESWNRCNKLIGVGYIAATRLITMRRIAATFAITKPRVVESLCANWRVSLSSRDEGTSLRNRHRSRNGIRCRRHRSYLRIRFASLQRQARCRGNHRDSEILKLSELYSLLVSRVERDLKEDRSAGIPC